MDRLPLLCMGMSFTPSTYVQARSPPSYALVPRRETQKHCRHKSHRAMLICVYYLGFAQHRELDYQRHFILSNVI